MERILTVLAVAVVIGVLALTAYSFWANPVNTKRQWLAAELTSIQPVDVAFEKPQWDFDGWQSAVAAKPALWTELIPPPPPPPPRPEPPPNLSAMIKGVTASRQGIGKKAKIFTPHDKRGAFMGVGDTIGGLTITEVSKTAVRLSLDWKGQELTVILPRE